MEELPSALSSLALPGEPSLPIPTLLRGCDVMPSPLPWTLQMKSYGRRPVDPTICLCRWHKGASLKMGAVQQAQVVRESRQSEHWKSEMGKKWSRFHGCFLPLCVRFSWDSTSSWQS